MPVDAGAHGAGERVPTVWSQFVDQAMAPWTSGQVPPGPNEPQPAPWARRSSALPTTPGDTYPPPAARVDAGAGADVSGVVQG